jgi:hypothetical protein
MCVDPATLATLTTVAQGAGAAISVVSTIANANAASEQAKYQAAVARNNQIIANNAALEAEEAGKAREFQARQAARKLEGRQRAVLAGNGVEVNTGSALDITEDTAAQGELDALNIRSQAEREAIGYRNQGNAFGADAMMRDRAGANALTSGYLTAGGQLLTGTGTVAQKWYNYRKEGVF